jgi:hypothetical protein
MAQVVECLLVKLEALIKTQYCEKNKREKILWFSLQGS